jgi:hypothetical protein
MHHHHTYSVLLTRRHQKLLSRSASDSTKHSHSQHSVCTHTVNILNFTITLSRSRSSAWVFFEFVSSAFAVKRFNSSLLGRILLIATHSCQQDDSSMQVPKCGLLASRSWPKSWPGFGTRLCPPGPLECLVVCPAKARSFCFFGHWVCPSFFHCVRIVSKNHLPKTYTLSTHLQVKWYADLYMRFFSTCLVVVVVMVVEVLGLLHTGSQLTCVQGLTQTS